jgi:2-C-methyl-D-erythritol 2,4-cyclodiphosphate synthase
LGAIGAPDLGEQFPPGDPRYRNADSRTFVRRAFDQVRGQGFSIGNVDATVIADAPKLTAYKARMRRAISELLQVEATRVSVKAKTTEGFAPGRGGIAAHTVVLLVGAQGSGLRARGRKAHSPQPRARSKR